MKSTLTKEEFGQIYDLLVSIGGAPADDKDNFIYHHTSDEGCSEWRFCGKLGFGGKYRGKRNVVDCYGEDETPERLKIMKELNTELSKFDKLNERELDDTYPVHIDYLYVCDGKVIRSDVQGTVADLKRDLRSHYKLEAKIITTCDIEGRRKKVVIDF